MKEQVRNALEVLMVSIKSGETYKNYHRMRKALKNQPEKAEQLSSFRREQYLISNERDGGFKKAEHLLLLEQEIKKDSECKDFLTWENEFCGEIREIIDEIMDLIAEEGEDTNGFT